MALQLKDVEVCKKYKIKQGFGNGPTVIGTVINVESDIKNGRPGVDYIVGDLETGEQYWAYLDDVSHLI